MKDPTTGDGSRLLTPQEVADVLRFKLETVYAMLRDGRLPHYKIGRAYRVSEQQLHDYLESRKSDGPPKERPRKRG